MKVLYRTVGTILSSPYPVNRGCTLRYNEAMPAPLLPKSEVVDRVMAVFRERGFEGATLARIAEATGLGKASLYHYFPGGKEDMGNVVLDVTEGWLREHVTGPLGGDGPPRQRIGRMLKSLDALYDGGNAA